MKAPRLALARSFGGAAFGAEFAYLGCRARANLLTRLRRFKFPERPQSSPASRMTTAAGSGEFTPALDQRKKRPPYPYWA
jgi:hypothetical protein